MKKPQLSPAVYELVLNTFLQEDCQVILSHGVNCGLIRWVGGGWPWGREAWGWGEWPWGREAWGGWEWPWGREAWGEVGVAMGERGLGGWGSESVMPCTCAAQSCRV